MPYNIATLLVDLFESYGIEYIFCVPGASIDAITTALLNRRPQLILCHQESGAGNMAAAYAKKTGKPAVVLVTAGPGATNVVTAAATATLEHTPLIVITGQMDSITSFKPTHQVINSEALFAPITKHSINITNPQTVASIWDMVYYAATTGVRGAVHIAFSSDLLAIETSLRASKPLKKICMPQASSEDIKIAIDSIHAAQYPLIILGADAASPAAVIAINSFLTATGISVICSFEASGIVTSDNLPCFLGSLGIFQNQPCNEFLKKADLILCIGYNIAELDPIKWNAGNVSIIHIAQYLPIVADGYHPDVQLLGSISANMAAMSNIVNFKKSASYQELQQKIREKMAYRMTSYTQKKYTVHPLYVIQCLQKLITTHDSIISDVGSHQYWLSEYFISTTPRQYITSMGFQTLGVSLAFAVGVAFAQHKQGKVYSISGDGGMLMCVMELATAVAYSLPIIHIVWKDNSYNLVAIQEEHHYHKTSAVAFKHTISFSEMARSFGAHGLDVTSPEELMSALMKAQTLSGPVVIDVLIDYSDNVHMLVENVS